MKRYVYSFLLFSILVLNPLHGLSDAHAHGTAYKLLQSPTLAAIQFQYSDGEPMAYAEVLVFSPQELKVEHQNGRTDRHGKFAFCPDMPGAWRISVNDGMGHLCKATVQVDQEAATGKAERPRQETDLKAPVAASRTIKIVAGLSLIANLAFAACFFRRRSNAGKGGY